MHSLLWAAVTLLSLTLAASPASACTPRTSVLKSPRAGTKEVQAKARSADLAEGFAMVANGEVELALFNTVELPAGVRLAGAVPAPLADHTYFETAVLAKGAAPEAAQAFIAAMTAPSAGRVWEAALLEPYPYR